MALATESGGCRRWVELAVAAEKVTPIVVRESVEWGSEKEKRKREMVRKIDRSDMAEGGRREKCSAAVDLAVIDWEVCGVCSASLLP